MDDTSGVVVETHPLHCALHPRQSSTMHVPDATNLTVTNTSGVFVLDCAHWHKITNTKQVCHAFSTCIPQISLEAISCVTCRRRAICPCHQGHQEGRAAVRALCFPI